MAPRSATFIYPLSKKKKRIRLSNGEFLQFDLVINKDREALGRIFIALHADRFGIDSGRFV